MSDTCMDAELATHLVEVKELTESVNFWKNAYEIKEREYYVPNGVK